MSTVSTTEAPPSAARDRYEAVIGVEVHCQLRTASKMFCSCSMDYDGAAPNSHVCPVCLGLPGALPVINRRAVEHVLATGLAVEATTPDATRWDRKNYFYPDLPKGYQISQYDLPLASAGRLAIETSDGPFTVGITRAHLEEDTAKLVHATDAHGRKVSLVDFNRSGAPLMEIVTDPDIRTAEQARRYAEELQLLLRTIGASDADMERGQMRVEANVSLRPRGTEAFGTRVEVKNMNSFRSVERAIEFEIDRQAAALDAGETLALETRGWSDERGETYHMRSKETSDDYRYFPEPDLPPLHVDPAWLEALRAAMPELPAARRARYATEFGLPAYDSSVIVADPDATELFEGGIAASPDTNPRELAKLVMGEFLRFKGSADRPLVIVPASQSGPDFVVRTRTGLAAVDIKVKRREGGFTADAYIVNPADVADLAQRVASGELSGTNAKEIFRRHIDTGDSTAKLVLETGLHQISDAETLGRLVDEAIAANPAAVADYRAGKVQAVGFLVGQVMKATRGQANAAIVQAAVRERLDRAE